MKGTEKQIKRATAIIEDLKLNFNLEFVLKSIANVKFKNGNALQRENITTMKKVASSTAHEWIEKIESINNATSIIKYKDFFFKTTRACPDSYKKEQAQVFFIGIAKLILNKKSSADVEFCKILGYTD